MVGILGLEGEGGQGFLGVKGLRMVFEGAERGDWEGRGGVSLLVVKGGSVEMGHWEGGESL